MFKFVFDLMVMSKKYNQKPLQEYILVSPAPVDLATRLSHTLLILADKVNQKKEINYV